MNSKPEKTAGFTLIELIMVITLTGILAVTLFPRLRSQSFNLAGISAKMATDIRYIQGLAMSSGQRFRINFTANSYQFTDINGIALTFPPSGSAAPISVAPATLSGYNPPLTNNYVVFNSAGIPFTDNANPGTALAANAVITLTSGSDTSTVTIAAGTGSVR